ncbi:hypothetical protein D3C71_1138060 [compost metagenome]
MLYDVVARHEVNHLRVQTTGQFHDQLIFTVSVTGVTDQAAQTNAAAVRVFQNTASDVVGCVHSHHFTGTYDVDLLRFVLADRHSETATHNVTQYVVGDEVHAVVSALLFQEVDRSDDTASCATYAWFRTAGFNAEDAAETGSYYVFELEIFNRTHFSSQVKHRLLSFRIQNQTSGVSFRVTANDHDLLTESGGQLSQCILGSGGFTDTAFAVECDLSQFLSHVTSSLRNIYVFKIRTVFYTFKNCFLNSAFADQRQDASLVQRHARRIADSRA